MEEVVLPPSSSSDLVGADPACAGCPRGDAAIGDLQADIQPEAAQVYRDVVRTLQAAHVPFLVGGAFALAYFTGIRRGTKDLDLFLVESDVVPAMEALRKAGFESEILFRHWLAKARRGKHFVDLIYNTGNACAPVTTRWFEHAREATVLGRRVLLCPPEETIWSKAYVQERNRFDGADIAHMLLACGAELDWDRMLANFGDHYQVLLSHLAMFGFIYPHARDQIPRAVLENLCARVLQPAPALPPDGMPLCQGTLLSRWQYRVDIEEWGLHNALVQPHGPLSPEDNARWSAVDESTLPPLEPAPEVPHE